MSAAPAFLADGSIDPLVGTANFTVAEYERVSSGGRVPDQYRANAQATLELLQTVRDALGVPVVITDGYRSPAHNAEVPGSVLNSQHLTASAADFDVPSLTKRAVGLLLDAAQDSLGDYHQFIYYLTDDHYHIGIGQDRQQLVKVDSTNYVNYTGADSLPDAHTPAGTGPWVLLALFVVAAVLLASRR